MIRLKACEHKLAEYLLHKGFTISDILEQVKLIWLQSKKKKKRVAKLWRTQNCAQDTLGTNKNDEGRNGKW